MTSSTKRSYAADRDACDLHFGKYRCLGVGSANRQSNTWCRNAYNDATCTSRAAEVWTSCFHVRLESVPSLNTKVLISFHGPWARISSQWNRHHQHPYHYHQSLQKFLCDAATWRHGDARTTAKALTAHHHRPLAGNKLYCLKTHIRRVHGHELHGWPSQACLSNFISRPSPAWPSLFLFGLTQPLFLFGMAQPVSLTLHQLDLHNHFSKSLVLDLTTRASTQIFTPRRGIHRLLQNLLLSAEKCRIARFFATHI